ncbi:hypothetical protein EJ03DRAFT_375434 [Teratosphaeria nubilosa]|uniref:NADAR domain-containing protein n=1 Tax=Teratosphaeria nubilosa TaxID=161662 RepID=A0A6G1L6N2_9PEZI|nr:hypothetical protein EJ03DRAFT_375434 [Teratosphaeria nubilosa]
MARTKRAGDQPQDGDSPQKKKQKTNPKDVEKQQKCLPHVLFQTDDNDKKDLQNLVAQQGLAPAKTKIGCAQQLLKAYVEKGDKDLLALLDVVKNEGVQSLKRKHVKAQLHQLQERLGVPDDQVDLAEITRKIPNRDGVTETTPRHMLNAKHQNFPPGEIQHGRTKDAMRITWPVHYADEDWNENRICFYSSLPHLGGCSNFLSNFYKCSFYEPKWRRKFNGVEQQYQWVKTRCISELADERFSHAMLADGEPISSKRLPALTIAQDNPQTIADLGRCFCSYMESDKKWWKQWNGMWQFMQPRVLYSALIAKFTDNKPLQDLLMMTGDFRLSESSQSDSDCGTGKDASNEIQARMKKTCHGQNLLGTMLEKVRTEVAEKHKRQNEYAFEYWTKYEKYFNDDRERRLDEPQRTKWRHERMAKISQLHDKWLLEEECGSGQRANTSVDSEASAGPHALLL